MEFTDLKVVRMRVLNKLLILFVLSALAPSLTLAKKPSPAAAATLESVMIMHVDGLIDIDPQGQVAQFQIDTPLSEKLHELLDRTVRTWRFEPVVVDGAPRLAHSRIRIVLAASKLGDGLQIKFDNVLFPRAQAERIDNASASVTFGRLNPPEYPSDLLRAGVSGAVLLGIRIGADGGVAQVTPIQTTLFDVKGSPAALSEAIQRLEQSAVHATKRWHFNVVAKSEQLTAQDMTVAVPISYSIGQGKRFQAGTWRSEVRIPQRPLEWLQDSTGTQKIGVSDVADGEVMPASSTVKLATNVVGSVLL